MYFYAQENFAETMRQLSAAWRNMSQQEKDRYRTAAVSSGSNGSGAGSGRAKTTGTSVSLTGIRVSKNNHKK